MTYDNWKTTNPEDWAPDDEHEEWDTCPSCDGFGSHEKPHPMPDDPYYCDVFRCDECNGAGYVRTA